MRRWIASRHRGREPAARAPARRSAGRRQSGEQGLQSDERRRSGARRRQTGEQGRQSAGWRRRSGGRARRKEALGLARLGVMMGALALGAAAAAPAATWVGIRYGFHDPSGELFEGSGDLEDGNLAGAQLAFDLAPCAQVEIAGELVSEELRFEEGIFAGIATAGEAELEDLVLYLTGRFDVFCLPLFPLRGYIGGGMNVQYADLSVTPSEGTSGELEEAIEEATGKRTRVGWHLVGGVRFAPASWPLAAFVEGRISDPFAADLPHFRSVYGGLCLRF